MIRIIKNKIIKNNNGNLIKFTNKNKLKIKFGEVYFSEVLPNKFKGWKYHEKRNQLLTIVSGKIKFFFKYKNKKRVVTLNYPNNISSIFIPKKTHYAFKCISKKKVLL